MRSGSSSRGALRGPLPMSRWSSSRIGTQVDPPASVTIVSSTLRIAAVAVHPPADLHRFDDPPRGGDPAGRRPAPVRAHRPLCDGVDLPGRAAGSSGASRIEVSRCVQDDEVRRGWPIARPSAGSSAGRLDAALRLSLRPRRARAATRSPRSPAGKSGPSANGEDDPTRHTFPEGHSRSRFRGNDRAALRRFAAGPGERLRPPPRAECRAPIMQGGPHSPGAWPPLNYTTAT